MADAPSGTRRFFGRVVDRVLPGSNYDASTGSYSNIGAGILGLGAKVAASAILGPAAGALVGKGAGYLIDRNGQPQFAPVQREQIPYTQDQMQPGQVQGQIPSMAAPNLGFGYMGQLGNFGNQQFGNRQAAQTGSWSPSSNWGAALAAPAPTAGAASQFGNNVEGFTSGDSGGSYGGSRMSNAIVGGRLAAGNITRFGSNGSIVKLAGR